MEAQSDTALAWEHLGTVLERLVQRMQPGTIWRAPSMGRIHVRAVVDGDQIVFRTWSKRKQTWLYRVEWVYAFYLWDKDGVLEYVGREKE
jgi:hypothetical protein